MRAALVTALDGPGSIRIDSMPEPPAAEVIAAGDVLVAVRCVALNHADVLMTQGRYQGKPDLPFSPGAEIAGVVAAAPAESGWVPGDRVMAYVGHGGAREFVAVAPWRLVAIPPGVGDREASGLAVTYGTAIHALTTRAPLRAGETLVVLGAAGGAGLAAVEIGRLLGARVVAVASRDKLDACLAHGADAVIDRDTPDLKAAIRAVAAVPAGPDMIYDCVGGALAEPALRSLRHGGRFLVVGFASRTVPVLPLDIVMVKSLDILGIHWPDAVTRDREAYRADMALALAAVVEGRLAPRVHGAWPLEGIGEAMGVLDRGEATGKVVVEIC